MIVCALCPTQRQIFCLSALQLTVPHHWKMSLIRSVQHSLSTFLSITNKSQWYPEVLHFCPTTPIILVGLKSDLRTKRTCIELLKTQGLTPITPEQGQAVAHRMGASYVECSSKEMRGVDDVFAQAVDTVVSSEEESWKPTKQSSSSNNRNSVKPSGGGRPGKKIKKRTCKIL